jgi:hypothetical protein
VSSAQLKAVDLQGALAFKITIQVNSVTGPESRMVMALFKFVFYLT